MATSDSMTGTIFAGRYRLERKLGSGGMADVWLAEDQELGRRVAVKILHERYANDEQFVERFRREATHAAGLSHQNIVSIYDRGAADGSYFIVMEYVEGRTLKELLVNRGPCPVPVAIAYARQILAALRYAHRNGIIHRDIKPHNVIVDREGRIQVADFGIARAGTSQMTEAGSIIGTAQYLSPEQARGAPVDESSDLYSTGVVLYELLTGAVPFTGETAVEIAMKHLSHVPAAPSTIRPEIPHDLDLVVLRALAKDPDDRYRSAADMDRDLELVARGEGVGRETEDAATTVLSGASMPTAVTQMPAGRDRRPPLVTGDERYRAYDSDVRRSRSPWPWLLVALGVALALAAGGYFLYDKVQQQIDSSKPLVVGLYTGIHEAQSAALVKKEGFEPKIERVANADVTIGDVFAQDPIEGSKLQRGDIVVLKVSTGKPKVPVPDLIGKSRDDAIAILVKAGLEPNPQPVPSDQPADTVTAQDPHAGVVVVAGSRVRINVSKGPKQVVLPSVIGLLYDQASAQLQAAGFGVKRTDVDSTQPANKVIDQSPTGNALVTQGTTVTLTVSKGPPTVQVPDVTNLDVDTAKATLIQAGFKVKVVPVDTQDPTEDNHVVTEDPGGSHGREARQRRDDHRRASRRAPDDARYNAGDDADHHPVSRRVRVAVLSGGRSSEHDISRASAASVIAALDPARYEVVAIEIARDGRWALPSGDSPAALTASVAETLPIPADSAPATLGAVDVVLPILHGPFGEDGTVQGLLRARGCRLCRPGRARLRALHGQGRLQARDARPGCPCCSPRRAPAWRSGREPVRLPGLRQARLGSARRSASRRSARPRSSSRRSSSRAATTRRCWSRSSSPAWRSRSPCSATCRRPLASLPGQVVSHFADWYDSASKYDEGGSDLIVPPPGLSDERESSGRSSSPCRPSSRPSARAWPRRLLRAGDRRRDRAERAEHDSRLHLDELLHPSVRGLRVHVRGARRSPDRARPGAPRAPQRARVLEAQGAVIVSRSWGAARRAHIASLPVQQQQG